jgi:hypothetical protein
VSEVLLINFIASYFPILGVAAINICLKSSFDNQHLMHLKQNLHWFVILIASSKNFCVFAWLTVFLLQNLMTGIHWFPCLAVCASLALFSNLELIERAMTQRMVLCRLACHLHCFF